MNTHGARDGEQSVGSAASVAAHHDNGPADAPQRMVDELNVIALPSACQSVDMQFPFSAQLLDDRALGSGHYDSLPVLASQADFPLADVGSLRSVSADSLDVVGKEPCHLPQQGGLRRVVGDNSLL